MGENTCDARDKCMYYSNSVSMRHTHVLHGKIVTCTHMSVCLERTRLIRTTSHDVSQAQGMDTCTSIYTARTYTHPRARALAHVKCVDRKTQGAPFARTAHAAHAAHAHAQAKAQKTRTSHACSDARTHIHAHARAPWSTYPAEPLLHAAWTEGASRTVPQPRRLPPAARPKECTNGSKTMRDEYGQVQSADDALALKVFKSICLFVCVCVQGCVCVLCMIACLCGHQGMCAHVSEHTLSNLAIPSTHRAYAYDCVCVGAGMRVGANPTLAATAMR